MKQVLIIAVLILTAFILINNYWPEGNAPRERRSVAERAAAPFRYAALLAKEPEAKIQIPIRAVKARQISDTFGAPRGSDRTHQGQEGYVWRIAENNLGGNTVWVIGAGGRVYYYAHLDGYAPDLKTGDPVTTDTVLGLVGDSGNAKGTPPHLHFGVYTSGGAINPITLFD
jgi:peptidoglycan LD-endopeptidase LytH